MRKGKKGEKIIYLLRGEMIFNPTEYLLKPAAQKPCEKRVKYALQFKLNNIRM